MLIYKASNGAAKIGARITLNIGGGPVYTLLRIDETNHRIQVKGPSGRIYWDEPSDFGLKWVQ